MYGAELGLVHHHGFGDFAEASAPGIVARLRDGGIDQGRVIDAGCGGGILTRHLLDAGYRVTGIDLSPAMIRIAREMAPGADFIVESIASAELPRCDAVVAIGEVFGYEAQRPVDLPGLFHRLAGAIRPGGMLIFDLLLQSAGAPMAYTVEREGDGWRVAVEVAEDVERSTVTRRIHTEVLDAGTHRESDEIHHVRAFEPAQVTEWLGNSGFDVETGSGYGLQPMLERRLAWFARRRASAAARPSH